MSAAFSDGDYGLKCDLIWLHAFDDIMSYYLIFFPSGFKVETYRNQLTIVLWSCTWEWRVLFFGSSNHSLYDCLHYPTPADIDKPLNEAACFCRLIGKPLFCNFRSWACATQPGRVHTHPFQSQTSRLLSTSLSSLGTPFPALCLLNTADSNIKRMIPVDLINKDKADDPFKIMEL
jgi:hypothetical protein